MRPTKKAVALHAGMCAHGPPSGVDYAALPAAAALAGLEVTPAAFRCFRTMEGVVAGALRARAEAERRRWRR